MKRSVARVLGAVLAALALLAGPVLVAGPAAAARPYCGIRWGSLEKSVPVSVTPETGAIANLRTGRHACYDRLVVDVQGGRPLGYTVRYVRDLVQDGSGETVAVRGGARLEVLAMLQATDAQGNVTYRPADRLEAVDVSRYRTFRQVAALGTFEGLTQVGLGVRARLPFRVFTLDGPGTGSRIVVDVAHRW